jgi:hypothetical protein
MGLINVLEDDLKQKVIKNECMICLAKSADAVILQCGHGGICFECGLTICHSKVNPRCHLCRKVRLYRPSHTCLENNKDPQTRLELFHANKFAQELPQSPRGMLSGP